MHSHQHQLVVFHSPTGVAAVAKEIGAVLAYNGSATVLAGLDTGGSLENALHNDMAMGQDVRYLCGDDDHLTVFFLQSFLGVHWGTGVLTHGHIE